jgi:glutamate-1-semialdehyde aminotransferase
MKSYLVGGTSTYSKGAWRGLPHYPQTLDYGSGAKVWTNRPVRSWIDWTASLGAVILGYEPDCYWEIVEEGPNGSLPLPHPAEERVAALLCEAVGAEKLRWCKNGSDATEAAVRLARHFTGRPLVITNSYHGSHSDLVAATSGKQGGVLGECCTSLLPASTPQELLQLLTRRHRDVAAVVMEPLTPTCQDWELEAVRQACTDWGVVLVFDEIITGFRTCYGSAAPQVQPDLACFGKAIANGFPLACLVGRASLMQLLEEQVFISGTYAGEVLSLLVCEVVLRELAERNYGWLVAAGTQLQRALSPLVTGYPQRLTFRWSVQECRPFVDALAKRGILVGRDWFPMFAHTQAHVEETVRAISEVRKELGV